MKLLCQKKITSKYKNPGYRARTADLIFKPPVKPRQGVSCAARFNVGLGDFELDQTVGNIVAEKKVFLVLCLLLCITRWPMERAGLQRFALLQQGQ